MRFRNIILDGLIGTAMSDGAGWRLLDRGRSVDESLRYGALAGGPRDLGTSGLPDVDAAALEPRLPLLQRPGKLWGIGLNYADHAQDLAETSPEDPASFLKGAHTVVGPDDVIIVPAGSERTTAEAELGVVIGRTAYGVSAEEAMDYVAGVCLILDQTEEGVLRQNPRFLTRAKNYPAFLSIGAELVTLDELLAGTGALEDVRVETLHNGELVRGDVVANMTMRPADLIAFHSRVMPLYPGDLISTGTPGAVVVSPGDVVACHIPGLGTLTNEVVAADDPRAAAQMEELLHV